MKTAAALATLALVAGYIALMQVDPYWGWTHPRGGLVTFGISLSLANLGVWLAGQTERVLVERFQFAVAAWIWFIVQAGCLAWTYWNATHA